MVPKKKRGDVIALGMADVGILEESMAASKGKKWSPIKMFHLEEQKKNFQIAQMFLVIIEEHSL